MVCPSLLKEYCTLEKSACTESSGRMRTYLATDGSPATWPLCPGCRKFGMSLKVERPRDTSKSEPNNGPLGTRASAAAISFCSSAEGEHTFSMLTFTCG